MPVAALANSVDVGGLAACGPTSRLGTDSALSHVLRLDAFLQHLDGFGTNLADSALGNSQEAGEILAAAAFEEVADDDESLTLGQERNGVSQVCVELARFEFLGWLDGCVIDEYVDEGGLFGSVERITERWRRDWESYGEMRTRRCTPDSVFSQP